MDWSISFEVLNVLLFLSPGFLWQSILETMVLRRSREISEKIIESLIFSLILYSISSLIFNKMPAKLVSVIVDNNTTNQVSFDSGKMVLVVILAIVFPILMSYIINNDYHGRLFRFLTVTSRTFRSNIWLDVIKDNQAYVIVNLNNGRRISGWIKNYSNTPEEGRLFLQNPAWVIDDEEKNQKYLETGLHGIFIINPGTIDYIEFHHPTKKENKDEE